MWKAIALAAIGLTGCTMYGNPTMDYNGVTNTWTDKESGEVIGCSQEEDEVITPC